MAEVLGESSSLFLPIEPKFELVLKSETFDQLVSSVADPTILILQNRIPQSRGLQKKLFINEPILAHHLFLHPHFSSGPNRLSIKKGMKFPPSLFPNN
ncbi:MAG: hypothetical protein ACI9YL_000224 [Luteibaculaceae bacterium]